MKPYDRTWYVRIIIVLWLWVMVPAFVAAEAWLGIRLSDRVNSERNTTKGNAQKDVLVSYVERSSPAAKAGLQVDVP